MTRFHSNFLTVVATLGTVVATVSAQGTNQRLTGSPSLETGAHVARIPVGSNLSSIRFEGVKTVLIPTQNKVSIDTRYCAEAAVRDPGGSMYCPAVEPETYVRVYQLTYSYEGQPLASDEFGNTHFTFNVYFRPEEIGPEAQKVLSQRHARPDAAELFELTTSTEWVARVAVDRDNSKFCNGNYADGAWAREDSQCKDTVNFKTISVPSEYIAVTVELASTRELASAE